METTNTHEIKTNAWLSFVLSLSVFFGGLATAKATDIKRTDVSKVYRSGQDTGNHRESFDLKPGLYVIGDERHKLAIFDFAAWGTEFLMVDEYVNNPDQVIALKFKREVYTWGEETIGRMYIGKKIKGGTSYMLAPVYIDINGNVVNDAEMNDKSQVLEISLRAGDGPHRYSYLVEGHNGALGGKLKQMRARNLQRPNLMSWPEENVMWGKGLRDRAIVITGNQIAVHDGRGLDQRYEVQNLNGDLGKFGQLVSTELNTMGEYNVSDTEVKKMCFYMKNWLGFDFLAVMTPTTQIGEFKFEFWGEKWYTFSDIFLPGAR